MINDARKKALRESILIEKNIVDRWWFPYNWNILTFVEIHETMTKNDIEEQLTLYSIQSIMLECHIHTGNSIDCAISLLQN